MKSTLQHIGERPTENGESRSRQYRLAVGANLLPTATAYCDCAATAHCDCAATAPRYTLPGFYPPPPPH
jgi:hypothetical protein